jgi:hypothetical protein
MRGEGGGGRISVLRGSGGARSGGGPSDKNPWVGPGRPGRRQIRRREARLSKWLALEGCRAPSLGDNPASQNGEGKEIPGQRRSRPGCLTVGPEPTVTSREPPSAGPKPYQPLQPDPLRGQGSSEVQFDSILCPPPSPLPSPHAGNTRAHYVLACFLGDLLDILELTCKPCQAQQKVLYSVRL